MQRAIELAREAHDDGEVPVGAVVVREGRILGEGRNRPIREHDPTAHAEIIALRDAARRAGSYRLIGATLYVTLEPCCMCAGAILNARIDRLVYGADDPRAGSVHTYFGLLDAPQLSHRVACSAGILAEESSDLLRAFFAERR